MDFRLNDLRNFIATNGCRTIVQAAQKLEISQPALSESLKRLESDCGAVLFFRSRNGIQLTPSGRTFMTKAREVLAAIGQLDLTPSVGTVFGGGTITLGCHPTVAAYTLPKSLPFLAKEAPDYRIELRHGFSREIQIAVQNGLIDLGIVVNPVSAPDLVVAHLGSDAVSVWAKGLHPRSDTLVCDPALFQTQSILKRWNQKPARVIATTSLDLAARLAQAGVGYAILPERAIALIGAKLKRVPHAPVVHDRISLVYRPEFGKTQAEQVLIASIKRAFA